MALKAADYYQDLSKRQLPEARSKITMGKNDPSRAQNFPITRSRSLGTNPPFRIEESTSTGQAKHISCISTDDITKDGTKGEVQSRQRKTTHISIQGSPTRSSDNGQITMFTQGPKFFAFRQSPITHKQSATKTEDREEQFNEKIPNWKRRRPRLFFPPTHPRDGPSDEQLLLQAKQRFQTGQISDQDQSITRKDRVETEGQMKAGSCELPKQTSLSENCSTTYQCLPFTQKGIHIFKGDIKKPLMGGSPTIHQNDAPKACTPATQRHLNKHDSRGVMPRRSEQESSPHCSQKRRLQPSTSEKVRETSPLHELPQQYNEGLSEIGVGAHINKWEKLMCAMNSTAQGRAYRTHVQLNCDLVYQGPESSLSSACASSAPLEKVWTPSDDTASCLVWQNRHKREARQTLKLLAQDSPSCTFALTQA